jgi:DNA-binding response OmpR family regulator
MVNFNKVLNLMREKICFLIDDDEDDREIFQLALNRVQDVVCITAHNGKEALKKLSDEDFNPDFIFLDLNMPLMNGKECLKEIRKMKRFNKTPILIYTTSSHNDDKISMEKLGATGFITKPTSVTILVEILLAYLSA